MARKAVKLSKGMAEYLAKQARYTASQPRNGKFGYLNQTPTELGGIWLKLTSSTLVSGEVRYDWTRQRQTAIGTFANYKPALSSTASTRAVNSIPKAPTLPDNSIVWAQVSLGSDGKAIYTFSHGSGVMFPVKVTQTGGSAGDNVTQCSFTYTVKDIEGKTLGTAKAPQKNRTSVGEYVAPAADSYGTAFYDDGGTLQLFDANEVPYVEVCEE